MSIQFTLMGPSKMHLIADHPQRAVALALLALLVLAFAELPVLLY